MVQTFQLFIVVLPVAVHVVVDVLVASGATGAVLCVNVAVFTQRQVPAALCAGWAPGSFIDLSVGSV